MSILAVQHGSPKKENLFGQSNFVFQGYRYMMMNWFSPIRGINLKNYGWLFNLFFWINMGEFFLHIQCDNTGIKISPYLRRGDGRKMRIASLVSWNLLFHVIPSNFAIESKQTFSIHIAEHISAQNWTSSKVLNNKSNDPKFY